VRVSYQLTESGRRFSDVATAIERWGRCLDAPSDRTKPVKPTRGRRARARSETKR